MRVLIRYRAAVLLGFLSVSGVFAGGRALGQEAATTFRTTFETGSTVSVATLRIPEKAWRHFAKAKSAAEHKRLAEADRETQKALTIAPNFAAAYLLRADAEVLEHSFDQAIANVKEARRIEPDVMWAGVVLAGAYNGLHRYNEARLVLSKLKGVESETWQAIYEAARAAVGMKDAEGALYLSALALNSAPRKCTDARLIRADAFILAHRWSDAEAQMEIYLQSKEPEERRAEVLTALGTVKQRVQQERLQRLALHEGDEGS